MSAAAELAALIRVRDEGTKEIEHFAQNILDLAAKFLGIPPAAVAAGVAIGGATAAIGGLVHQAFELGESFDAAFDKITIRSGATGERLEALQEDFRAVVQAVPASFADASEAVGSLAARTGQTGEALQHLAEQELELARLTGTDLRENIRETTRMFGDWGIASDQQGAALDKLMFLSQQTGAGINDLAQNVVQFGAPMRELGFSFDEAISLMAKWEQEGVNIDTVSGTMRIAIAKFAEAGVDAKEVFPELVASIQEMEDPIAATALAMEVFGKRGGADMAAAIREGRFAIDDMVDSLAGAEGSIMETAEQTDDAKERIQKAMNEVAVAFEPVGTAVFELAGNIAEGLTPVITTFAEDLKNIITLIQGFASGTINVGVVVGEVAGDIAKALVNMSPAGIVAQLAGHNLGEELGEKLGITGQKKDELIARIQSSVADINNALNPSALAAPTGGGAVGGSWADAAEEAADAATDAVADAATNAKPKPVTHDAAYWREVLGLGEKGKADAKEHATKAATEIAHEVAQLTVESFNEAFAAASQTAGLGAGKGISEAVTRAALEGGQGNIDQLARQAADIRERMLHELDPDEAEAAISELFERINAAIVNPTAENRRAVGEYVETFDISLKLRELGQQRADAINAATDIAHAAIVKAQEDADANAEKAQADFDKQKALADKRKALEKDLKDAQDAVRDRQQTQQQDTQTARAIEDRELKRQQDEADKADRHQKDLAAIDAKGQAAINEARSRGDTVGTVRAMLALDEQRKALAQREADEAKAEQTRQARDDAAFLLQQQRRQEDLAQRKADAAELLADPAVKAAQEALDSFNAKVLQDNLDEKIQGYFDARDRLIEAANQRLVDETTQAEQRFDTGVEKLAGKGGNVYNIVQNFYNTNNGYQGSDVVDEMMTEAYQQAADNAALGATQ